MALRNLVAKCRVNFTWALCLYLIITQDRLALSLAPGVEAIIVQAKSPCQNRIINDYEGVITSPNYPSPFPEDVECEWRIRSPPNTILKIDIADLDISEDETCLKFPCCNDHRLSIIRDGNPIVLCGNYTFKRTITIYQPVTPIKYYSSKNNCEGRGFKLIYSIELHSCKPNELACMDGKCYPKSNFCNGLNICGDGSDEAYCYHIAHTANYDSVRKEILEHEFRGIDYPGLGDHWICKDGSVRCPLSPGRCFFPSTDICDGKFDCPRGEEEVGCNPLCPKQIACANGDGCYYPVHRCNGMRNCRDNSDETGCVLQSCVAMEFTCLNGACILGSAVCDGDDDCGDFSDEENCSRTSFMKVAVIGLLTCILLFCIVLGCMYHVYTSRLRASETFVHQLEPEPPEEDFIFREPPPAYSVAMNDPRLLTYPNPEMTERFYENDHGMRYQGGRNAHRGRRQLTQGNVESTSGQRGSGARNSTGGNDFNVDPKTDDTDKAYDREGRSEFQRQLELRGLVRTLQDDHIFGNSVANESPYSSPSSSPSRESMTSCTSLDDIEDLVNIFHR